MTNTTPNSGTDRATQAARETAERASEKAQMTAEQARARAEGMAGEARHRAEDAREEAGSEIHEVSDALSKAADELGGDRYSAQLLRYASAGLEDMARNIRGRDLASMAGDVSDFGRRHPVAFLGAAALAGFAIARFAKATTEPGGTAHRSHAGTGSAPDLAASSVPRQPVPPASNDPVTQPVATPGGTVARPAPDVQTRREIDR